MKKKTYLKPNMKVIQLQQSAFILTGSEVKDNYGMKKVLQQQEEVTEAW
jgi:hypothetical protein